MNEFKRGKAAAVFKDDVKRGSVGEQAFLAYFQNYILKNDLELIDVSDDKKYQKYDIDFFLEIKDKFYALEMKTDSYESGNMFYEEFSNLELNTNGCFNRTRANVILYYFSANQDLYVFYDVNKFREWYLLNAESFRHCPIKNRVPSGAVFHAYGGLIPLAKLEKAMLTEDFVVKYNLGKNEPQEVVEGIFNTNPYEKGENIDTSNKTKIMPSFRMPKVKIDIKKF